MVLYFCLCMSAHWISFANNQLKYCLNLSSLIYWVAGWSQYIGWKSHAFVMCREQYFSSEVAYHDRKYLLDPCIFGRKIGFLVLNLGTFSRFFHEGRGKCLHSWGICYFGLCLVKTSMFLPYIKEKAVGWEPERQNRFVTQLRKRQLAERKLGTFWDKKKN